LAYTTLDRLYAVFFYITDINPAADGLRVTIAPDVGQYSRYSPTYCEGNGFPVHTYFYPRPHPLFAFVDVYEVPIKSLIILYKLCRKLFQSLF